MKLKDQDLAIKNLTSEEVKNWLYPYLDTVEREVVSRFVGESSHRFNIQPFVGKKAGYKIITQTFMTIVFREEG